MRPVKAVDLFCGAGGTSTGLALAVQAMGGVPGKDLRLIGINHWETAVATHRDSHPWAEHRCERVESIDRTTVFPGERIDLLVASPECTSFSPARGGKPVEDQKRAGAWYVLDWVGDRRPSAVLLENVPAFTKWGRIEKRKPKGNARDLRVDHRARTGRPLKHDEGGVFTAYLQAFRALGYNVDWRVLNAADYGAATTRRRLFIMARKGRKPVTWPEPTHSEDGAVPGTLPWRSAREILDFSLPSHSIFTRGKCACPGCQRRPLKPLAQRTLDRIAKGIREGPHGSLLEPLAVAVEDGVGPVPLTSLLGARGLAELHAWTLGQHGGAIARPVGEPVATIAAGGAIRLIEALIIGAGGPARQGEPRSAGATLPTLLAENHLALVETLIHLKGTGTTLPTSGPVPSLQAGGEHVALAEAFILPPQGIMGGPEANRARPVDSEPVQTLTQRGGGHLVEPSILHLTHGGRTHDPSEPLPAVTGAHRGELALAETAVLLPGFGEREGQALRVRSPSEPLHTVHGGGAGALAYLASYYGNGDARPLTEPVPALTTHDRFALVQAALEDWVVDVRLRMLHPTRELAPAMGFPPGYAFTGTRTQITKQIGNAVEVNIARALCGALLTGTAQPVLPIEAEAEVGAGA